jgi:hypothetical protein
VSTSFPSSSAGKSVCFDTSRFMANRPIQPPALYPIYFTSSELGGPIFPRWPGTRCFTVWDCGNKTSGNVDCDPADAVDISDLTRMIDFLFISQQPLCCPIEANVDGAAGVDMSDLTRMIDHLYLSFAPLADLP